MDQNQQIQDESKAGIGFVCAFFLGLIGLVVGFCCFKEGTYERKTFMKAYWITFGVCTGIAVIAVIAIFVLYGSFIGGLIGSIPQV